MAIQVLSKYNLVRVELPKYTNACQLKKGSYSCDYKEQLLFKQASERLLKPEYSVLYNMLSRCMALGLILTLTQVRQCYRHTL